MMPERKLMIAAAVSFVAALAITAVIRGAVPNPISIVDGASPTFGSVTVNGDLEVQGSTELDGGSCLAPWIGTDLTLSGDAEVQGATELDGGSCLAPWTGTALTLTGALDAQGATEIDGGTCLTLWTSLGGLNVTGATVLDGGLTLHTDLTIEGTSGTVMSIDGDGIIDSSQTLDDATGDEIAQTVFYTINKATSGDAYGLYITSTETAVPSAHYPINVDVALSPVWTMDNTGSITPATDATYGRSGAELTFGSSTITAANLTILDGGYVTMADKSNATAELSIAANPTASRSDPSVLLTGLSANWAGGAGVMEIDTTDNTALAGLVLNGRTNLSIEDSGTRTWTMTNTGGRLFWTLQYDVASNHAFNVESAGARELTASSGTQAFLNVGPRIAQSGTAGYDTLLLNTTVVSGGSGAQNAIRAVTDAADVFTVSAAGQVISASTIFGTTGIYAGTAGATLTGFTEQEDDGMHLYSSVNSNVIVTKSTNRAKDHDHDTASTDPTFWIHSATDPDADNSQWMSLAYTAGNATITSGDGGIVLDPASGGIQMGTIEGTSPAEPVACGSTTVGTFTYVDDTDDSGAAYVCVCIATGDDGAGAPNAWDWRRMDDHTTACPAF